MEARTMPRSSRTCFSRGKSSGSGFFPLEVGTSYFGATSIRISQSTSTVKQTFLIPKALCPGAFSRSVPARLTPLIDHQSTVASPHCRASTE